MITEHELSDAGYDKLLTGEVRITRLLLLKNPAPLPSPIVYIW
jgi:hypothetical protein